MPCLMHLGLHCWFRCCTGALQGRCTYSAHTRLDTFVHLIQSGLRGVCWSLYQRCTEALFVQRPIGSQEGQSSGAVQALYKSAVRTAPICSELGQCFGAVQALFISAVRTAPLKKSAWCSSFFQVRRCTRRSTYSDLYSAQGKFGLTYQNASLCF